MAVSSISATRIPSIPLPNSSPFPSKPKLSSFSFYTCKASKLKPLKPSLPSTRVYAAPEVLESPETLDPPLETPDESDPTTFEMAPKQKIRIKLRSYWVPLIEDSCKQILDAARTTNAKTMGPIPF
ncbi:hypothetical protein ACJW30_06G021200 [Castanea mollissima]